MKVLDVPAAMPGSVLLGQSHDFIYRHPMV